VRLERHQRRLGSILCGGGDCAPDHVGIAEVDAIEAADSEGDRADRARGEPKVHLQLSTFS
jgi:hypothetical protein